MIDIIGVPFDLGGRRSGSRLGPAVIRLAGLSQALAEQGYASEDGGDLPFRDQDYSDGGLIAFQTALPVYSRLKGAVFDSLEAGNLPIVLGGDHSISIGSISGALQRSASNLAVLWIDAHADINEPATSPSGNLHGMPLAALMRHPTTAIGLAGDQWRRLTDEVVSTPLQHISWIGLREVDAGESQAIAKLDHPYASTMHDVDRLGISGAVLGFDAWIRQTGATDLWVSFDVDCLDPILAPGTGTAVRGGLTYREGHLCAELLCELLRSSDCPYRLVGMDIVETNPLFDTNNETARLAVEWVASLFGKTILRQK